MMGTSATAELAARERLPVALEAVSEAADTETGEETTLAIIRVRAAPPAIFRKSRLEVWSRKGESEGVFLFGTVPPFPKIYKTSNHTRWFN
jgi:hypothetical protein